MGVNGYVYPSDSMATMDDLIKEMLAEYEPRFILDEPIPEAEERLLPRPLRPQWPFTDLDDRVPHPVSFWRKNVHNTG